MRSRKMMTIAFVAMVAGSMLWPEEAQAQRRRVVVRRPVRSTVFLGVGYGSPYYYRPWFYNPWYAYAYPYGFYPPYAYGYYGRGYPGAASLRLQVEPKETEVFIDGYWAGTVDDFDGFFQRLRLEPGEHEIQLYLDGHRSKRQKVYLQPDATFRVRHTMEPLGTGEAAEPRPSAPAGPPPSRDRYDAFGRPGRGGPDGAEPQGPPASRERGAYGTLAVRVQPQDADVFIDGEAWDGSDSSERLMVELPEGEHRVEVRKDGFTTYSSTVRVRSGQTTTLNVSLTRE